ncbi:hypothetical protein EOI86_09180 [Hwanghaeella grinnelliae]|uniref:Uncharacterized protein n=1 Tax=Hwanghaeella grinnelliae TaxID=2500179 RepID=A0A437QY43_9PROT|nr:hypothetical protein [Hwanghaeella grinnelliae]RVU39393.1 hypothetical protein EOI86_09180 [Hwanghaeella grinnelliae]
MSNGAATSAKQIELNDVEPLDDALNVAALNLVAAVVDAVCETEAIPKAWLQLRIFVRTKDGVSFEPVERITNLLHLVVPEGAETISPTVVGVVQLPLQASVTIDGILALH